MQIGKDSFLLHQLVSFVPLFGLTILPSRFHQRLHVANTSSFFTWRTLFSGLLQIVLGSLAVYCSQGFMVGLLITLIEMALGIAGNDGVEPVEAIAYSVEQVLVQQDVKSREDVRFWYLWNDGLG